VDRPGSARRILVVVVRPAAATLLFANEAGSRRGRASPPLLASGKPSPPAASMVVLAGRATRVPEGAGTGGIQRSITVTPRGLLRWASAPDLDRRHDAKLHGMQAFTRD
jgi:hypothetical protein